MAVLVDSARCIGCGACVVECPVEALDLVDGVAVVDPAKCKDTGSCVKVCPTNALSLPEGLVKPSETPQESPGSKYELNPPLPDVVKDYVKTEKKATQNPVNPGEIWSGVWVVFEYSRGEIAPVSWELLGEGRKLADELGCELAGVLIGHDVEKVIPEAFAYGAEKVYVIDDPVLKDYRTEPYSEAVTQLVRKYQPEIILMGATAMGRDVFPVIATKMKTGLTADCTVLGIDPDAKLLLQTRPAFGGNIMATILCKKYRPQMATVRAKVMKALNPQPGKTGRVVEENILLAEDDIRTKVLEIVRETTKQVRIDEADIIVAGGKGLGSSEGFQLIHQLADVLGGAVGASRDVVEAGWVEHPHQVGQTGVTVTPKIYFAIGVSGAIQHLVGMKNSSLIIAINKDSEAPIFDACHYGIVGDAFEIVPLLIEQFKKVIKKEEVGHVREV